MAKLTTKGRVWWRMWWHGVVRVVVGQGGAYVMERASSGKTG